MFFQDVDVGVSLSDEAREEIKQQALIYKKVDNRPLTSFQSSVNEAAVSLALSNPVWSGSGATS